MVKSLKGVLLNKVKKKSGSTMILTLIVVNIVFLFSLYLLNRLDSMMFYNSNSAKQDLREDIVAKHKEYLMARLNDLLLTNKEFITTNGIEEFYMTYKGANMITYEKSYIKLDNNYKNNKSLDMKIYKNKDLLSYKVKVYTDENKFRYEFIEN
jgi:hypothetical protein